METFIALQSNIPIALSIDEQSIGGDIWWKNIWGETSPLVEFNEDAEQLSFELYKIGEKNSWFKVKFSRCTHIAMKFWFIDAN